jgi:glutathionylspermidine synthase
MRRQKISERPNWIDRANEFGFTFHHVGGEKYWDENHAYLLTLEQAENDIEDPATEVHGMCLALVDKTIGSERLMEQLAIPARYRDLVANSWRNHEPSLYGRFDFAYDGSGPAKLLEYNADTPTSIYETAFFQWQWLEEMIAMERIPPQADQFNALHEALVERFAQILPAGSLIHFASVRDHIEDRQTVLYLEDLARQAGLDPQFVGIDEIGVDADGRFVDEIDVFIHAIFKLYPWEDMLREDFAGHIASSSTRFIEPAWKALLSNKGILPLLWQEYPGHPNLLPAAFDGPAGRAMVGPNHVRKPLFSREGWDIEINQSGERIEGPAGGYGAEGFILQRYAPLANHDGAFAVIGAWIVGDKAVAMSVREDSSPITRDLARYVPHVILEEGLTIRD